MCARFSITVPVSEFIDYFGLDADEELVEDNNIAPTMDVAAIVQSGESHKRKLQMFRWGLVPPWSKDLKIGQKLINARAETIFERSAFREAARHRRCLIPASGFYEWREENGKKQPYLFTLRSGKPMAFAGLWESKRTRDGELRTCTIVTTAPNDLIADFHDRIPALLTPDEFEAWLDTSLEEPRCLSPLLAPIPSEELEYSLVEGGLGRAGSTPQLGLPLD